MTSRARLVHVAVIVAGAFLVRAIHLEYRAPRSGSEGILAYVVLGLVFALVTTVMDSPPRTARVSTVLVSALGASLVGLGAMATMQLFFPEYLPRFSILAMTALVFVWLLASGTIGAWNARNLRQADRVVAVVTRADADALILDAASRKVERPFVVADSITADRDFADITNRCDAVEANVLVLGTEALISGDVVAQAEMLHRRGLRIRSLDDFYDERLGKLPLSSLDSFALMGDIESLHGSYAPLKRASDLLFATLGTVVLLLLFPFVLLGNLVANRGPLLFRQERVGLFGEPFSIIKFRTMTPGAVDISGWTSNNDPRITGFGKLMRRLHIDELPQVFNIFAGELSVVGPRPEQVTYVRDLERALPFYSARHLVRPGLTGWAQVRYPYAASEEDAFIKLQYDLYYVRHESFTTDIRIILLTVSHLLSGGGR
ncbi:MAG TPA: sugar transferase [Ilumatobacteraceae bacterium]|nr:sugar transferase [Ilumatobacteraceae bacterium]